MTIVDDQPTELLRQAIAIGENMIRIADAVGQPIAGNYFSIGLDILRAAADAEAQNAIAIAPLTDL